MYLATAESYSLSAAIPTTAEDLSGTLLLIAQFLFSFFLGKKNNTGWGRKASALRESGRMANASKNFTRMGEQVFQKMDKINAEVFTLTYGSMVQQLLKVRA